MLINSLPPLLYGKYIDIILKLNTINDPYTFNLKDLFAILHTIEEEGIFIKLSNCITSIVFETKKANGFQHFFKDCYKECKNDSTEISVAMGKLFSVIWKMKGHTIEQIITICESLEGFQYKWGLYSIAFIVVDDVSNNIDYCWNYYLSIKEIKKQFLWAHIILPKLISLNHGEDSFGLLKRVQNIYIDFIHSKRENQDCTTRKPHVLQQLNIAINSSDINESSFRFIFKARNFSDSNIWLSKELLGILLPRGLIFNHKGAEKALELFITDPKKYDNQISSHLCNEISAWEIDNLDFLKKAISLLISLDDTVRLRKLISNNQLFINEIDENTKNYIIKYKNRLVLSKSSKDRLSGIYLWTQLVDNKIIDFPTIDFIRRAVKVESDKRVIGALAQLISHSCGQINFEFEKLHGILSKFLSDNNQNVREKSIKALMDVLLNMQDIDIKSLDLMLDITITENINTNLLRSFGYLIEKHFEDRIDLSFYIFKRLLTSKYINRMTNYSKRSFVNIMRKPARRLFSIISLDERIIIIDLVPSTDPKLGRIIIDAACYEHFDQHITYLNKLLNDPNVNSEIKNQILHHKHLRERSIGSEGWPELIEEALA